MNNFRVISKKFYNQFRNGTTFASNLTEFTDRLQGNVGEKLQLIEEIEVETIINQSQSIDMSFIDSTTSCSLIADFLDFEIEGLYNGANIVIQFNGTAVIGVVENITGSTKQELVLDSATRTLLLAQNIQTNQCYDDIVIIVTDVPDYLTFKYGINPNALTVPNYKSPLDTNEQAYYLNGIIGTYKSMVWVGSEIGSSLGSVQIKFDSTASLYKHKFTVKHDFLIPFYTEEQSSNINQLRNPIELQSSRTLKYGNGFFFGQGKNVTTMDFEDLGKIGNVGYFDENFSGKILPYTSSDLVITNSLSTGFIEGSVDNLITFSIASSTATGFVGGEKIILNHSMLPQSTAYGRQKGSFDSNWLFESLEVTEGAAATSGTIITLATAVFNAISGELDVQFTTRYSLANQAKINDSNQLSMYVTLATENLANPDTQDRGNVMVDTGPIGQIELVSGLVTNWQPNIYEQWDSVSLTKGFTNFDGYNGDLLYQTGTFEIDLTKSSRITDFKFRLIADNGSTNFLETQVVIPIGQLVESIVSGVNYQVFNYNITRGFNMSQGLNINSIKLSAAAPTTPFAIQTWTFSIGFNVSWREWIQNLNVPTSFIDPLEPQNNRNQKSSNYSGVSSYDIKTELLTRIQSDGTSGGTVITPYELLSDNSRILDYDTANAGFSAGVVKYYNNLNVLSTDIDSNIDGRIEIEFTHSLGVITLADIKGYIEIEIDQSNIEPFYLSTDIDMTDTDSPLKASDTLLSGNTTLVEVVSVNNLVTFICGVNSSNTSNLTDYNIYGRISNRL